jgi:selenocysteine-specific elongation factor
VDQPSVDAPLTVGTAGHIDHGKTALVRALTGVETDRLPEEQARGMTIVLGYAPLRLPSGRMLSLVDVPGHERLVRVMVAGASGIDLFLLVVAADDGVMPQTVEHLRVLDALGVEQGVVAVTKADLADPEPARTAVRELAPGLPVVACSARTGVGVGELAAALERVATSARSRADRSAPVVLHVDRSFTIRGAGTVATGTLWRGTLAAGDRLTVLPRGVEVRVRGLEVHGRAVDMAPAGQRVAVNLTGAERKQVGAGDVLAGTDAGLRVAYRLEAELRLHEQLKDRGDVGLHHGTRFSPARAVRISEQRWQLRCEQPFVIGDGDRIVIRRLNPPQTLGGGVVEPSPVTVIEPEPRLPPAPIELGPDALALEQRLRDAGYEPPNDSELGELARELPALVATGRAVRIGRSMHAHSDAIANVRAVVERVIEAEGQVTLARLRDELGTSRKYAHALLEHLDAARVTRRREDDSRVLSARPASA